MDYGTSFGDYLGNRVLLREGLREANLDLEAAQRLDKLHPAHSVTLSERAGAKALARLGAYAGVWKASAPKRSLLQRYIALAVEDILPRPDVFEYEELEAAVDIIGTRASRLTSKKALIVGLEVAGILNDVETALESGFNPARVAFDRVERSFQSLHERASQPGSETPEALSRDARSSYESACAAIKTVWLHSGVAAQHNRDGLGGGACDLRAQWRRLMDDGVVVASEPPLEPALHRLAAIEIKARHFLGWIPPLADPEGPITVEERQEAFAITARAVAAAREALADRLASLAPPTPLLQAA